MVVLSPGLALLERLVAFYQAQWLLILLVYEGRICVTLKDQKLSESLQLSVLTLCL
jgi:hypothetical protein